MNTHSPPISTVSSVGCLVTVGSPVLAGFGAALGDGVGVGAASAVVSVWAAVSVVLAPPGPVSLTVAESADSFLSSAAGPSGKTITTCSLPDVASAVPVFSDGVVLLVPAVGASVLPLSGVMTVDASLPFGFSSPSAAAIAGNVQSITSKSSMLTAFFPYLFIFLLLLPQGSHRGFFE